MSSIKYFGIIAISAALCGGCEGPQEDTEQLQQKGIVIVPSNSSAGFVTLENGYVSKGIRKVVSRSGAVSWNLMTLDPVSGISDDSGAAVDSITYNGAAVTSLSTTQGWFQITTGSGGSVKVDGTSFQLDFHFGAPISGKLRLSSSDNATSYGRYTAHFLPDAQGASWKPFCHHWYSDGQGTAEDIAEPLIPVPGSKWMWNGSRIDDSAAISFGCTNDAVGACVDWGYAPWDSVGVWAGWPPQYVNVSLKDYHQSCTRMKRADFCGTGQGNTSDFNSATNSTHIQVWDALNVHPADQQTRATMEAYWTPSGAACVNRNRLRANSQYYLDKMNDALNNVCPQLPECYNTSVTGYTASGRPCYQDPNTQAWICP